MQSTVAARRFSAWQAPVMSFFNKQFYVEVVNRWQGTGAAYMVVACLLAAIFQSVPMAQTTFTMASDPQLAGFLLQIPRVTYADGHVQIDKKCPYLIKDQRSGAVLAEFRTEDPGMPKLAADGPPIVVTRDGMAIAQARDAEPKLYAFSKLASLTQGFSFDGQDALRCMRILLIGAPIVLTVVCWPLLLFLHLIQMALYGLVAYLIFEKLGMPVPYASGVRLAAMAMTPAIVVSSFASAFAHLDKTLMLFAGLLWIPITIGVIAFAASACRDAARNEQALSGASPT